MLVYMVEIGRHDVEMGGGRLRRAEDPAGHVTVRALRVDRSSPRVR